MSNIRDTKNKIKSQIEAIKRLNDDTRKDVLPFDNLLKDLPSTISGKKVTDYPTKKNIKEQKNDIFSDLLDIVEGFVGKNRVIEQSDVLSNKQKIKQITINSIDHAIKKSKNIVYDNIKKSFFADEGICGTNKILLSNSVQLKPNEFDLMNILTVDPKSNTGKILYEDDVNRGLVKMNAKLYNAFTTPQSFVTKQSNIPLFNIVWNETNQEYTFSNLTSLTSNMEDFLNQYYSNIEFTNLNEILRTALQYTLHGDGSEPVLFDMGVNDLNRILRKLFTSCGNPATGLNQTTLNQFNENDDDIEFYFDFDDIEGVDLDEENAKYQKILKFRDCQNYEIKINPEHFEDFIYISKQKNINDAISDALYHTAGETYEKSGQSQPLDNFHISLMNDYIKNLPKSLLGVILSPKYVLPIAILYKLYSNVAQTMKQMMKKLSKLFHQIIREIYWEFISKFWKLVKVELLSLLNKTAKKILKNKLKKYYTLITSLIALLTKLLELNLDNCDSLYKIISTTIDLALSGAGGGKLRIPGLLLSLSDLKPGYSSDRAFINIIQKLQKSGIDTGPIYGETNKILDLIKSIVDGEDEERNLNGYVKSSNKLFTIVGADGVPIIFPPGIIPISGVNV